MLEVIIAALDQVEDAEDALVREYAAWRRKSVGFANSRFAVHERDGGTVSPQPRVYALTCPKRATHLSKKVHSLSPPCTSRSRVVVCT